MTKDHFIFPQSHNVGEVGQSVGGLTMRDYFAASALQAITTEPRQATSPPEAWADVATIAYKIADALIAERERTSDDADGA